MNELDNEKTPIKKTLYFPNQYWRKEKNNIRKLNERILIDNCTPIITRAIDQAKKDFEYYTKHIKIINRSRFQTFSFFSRINQIKYSIEFHTPAAPFPVVVKATCFQEAILIFIRNIKKSNHRFIPPTLLKKFINEVHLHNDNYSFYIKKVDL